MKNIEVYTMNHCSYCDAAKALLRQHGLSFKEINISGDDAQRIALVEKTHHRTMPQIFIDGEFVGGYVDLKKHLEEISN